MTQQDNHVMRSRYSPLWPCRVWYLLCSNYNCPKRENFQTIFLQFIKEVSYANFPPSKFNYWKVRKSFPALEVIVGLKWFNQTIAQEVTRNNLQPPWANVQESLDIATLQCPTHIASNCSSPTIAYTGKNYQGKSNNDAVHRLGSTFHRNGSACVPYDCIPTFCCWLRPDTFKLFDTVRSSDTFL